MSNVHKVCIIGTIFLQISMFTFFSKKDETKKKSKKKDETEVRNV